MYMNFEQVTIYYEISYEMDLTVLGITHENLHWVYYRRNEDTIENCGKWMLFFDENSYQFAIDICNKAVAERVVNSCKHTLFEHETNVSNTNKKRKTGVICFYLNGRIFLEHIKILEFFKTNNLFRKTKTGKLYNISFKFDYQTIDHEYGKDFSPKLRLSNFMDLSTGIFFGDIKVQIDYFD